MGAFLHFIVFGIYPKKLSDIIPLSSLRNTKEPSEFIYFDIVSFDQLKTIIEHDYDVKVESASVLLEKAILRKSFSGIFDDLVDRNKLEREEDSLKDLTHSKVRLKFGLSS